MIWKWLSRLVFNAERDFFWAHLEEFPDYYTRLEQLEVEADAWRKWC